MHRARDDDSQYTPEEYSGEVGMSKLGWDHSTFAEAVKLAQAANVKRRVLFHYDPSQSDVAVREKQRRAKALFPDVVAAFEGLTIDIKQVLSPPRTLIAMIFLCCSGLTLRPAHTVPAIPSTHQT